MNTDIHHCVGPSGVPCGRYAPVDKTAGWHMEYQIDRTAYAYTCPECFASRVRAKIRASVIGGKPMRDWTADERAVASQMLGRDLVTEMPAPTEPKEVEPPPTDPSPRFEPMRFTVDVSRLRNDEYVSCPNCGRAVMHRGALSANPPAQRSRARQAGDA